MTLQLSQYGVTLKRVEQSDIELIRKWRNHPDIRKYMAYRKKISESAQLEWFNAINNEFNYYFLIRYNGAYVGVINCKDVNLKEEYGEGGIFVWDKEIQHSPIPVFASLILLDFIFNELEIGDKSFVRILPENQRAIVYNQALGYVKVPHQEKIKNQVYVLTKESYNKKAEKLRIAAKNYTGTDGKLDVSGGQSKLNIEKLNRYLANLG